MLCGLYSVIFAIGLFVCVNLDKENIIMLIISIALYLAIFVSFVLIYLYSNIL